MSKSGILKALDVEQRERRALVWENHERRMKKARAKLSAAKAAMKAAETQFTKEQEAASAQHNREMEAVQAWAMEARRVALGRAPLKPIGPRVVREIDGMKVSLPVVSCLESRA